MQQIKIITPDPIVEALLSLLAEQLPEPKENTLLLDAVWMERMEKFPGIRIILFTASADPAYLTMARESGAAGFWYLRPSVEALLQIGLFLGGRNMIKVRLADTVVAMDNRFSDLEALCKDYVTLEPEQMLLRVTEEEIAKERTQQEFFPDGYLETVCIYRKLALEMLQHQVLNMARQVVPF